MIRVFRNLVDNALKYGGDSLSKIEIACSESDESFTITVSDDGEGIQSDSAEDIFTLFKRNSAHRKIEGSGIGLAVVKEIVNQHNGNVWVQSKKNTGTSFFISIPKSNATVIRVI